MNFSFDAPELLLLAIPAGLWLQSQRPARGLVTGLRAACLALLVIAAAGPNMRLSGSGRDLVLVIDRSLSMPTEAEDAAFELLRFAKEQRGPNDRLGLVTFGAQTQVEAPLLESIDLTSFDPELDRGASDLTTALELAESMIPQGRAASLLVLSDGRTTGRDTRAAAFRLGARGLTTHVRLLERAAGVDYSLRSIELPEEVEAGAPFQFAAWVHSDRSGPAQVVLRRAGKVISERTAQLQAGENRLLFRDRHERAGLAEYSVEVRPALESGAGALDATPENDTVFGALRVRGPKRVALLNDEGRADSLSEALRSAGLEVDVLTPERFDASASGLAGYRTVILENVDADRLTAEARRALAAYVTDHGGGLVLTGGRAAFGRGGYFRSELDPLLPVSMELRQEHRKLGLALVVALDRSGSMSAAAAGGTKMDLANAGTAAAISTLTSIDSVAVLAVDTVPHVVQAMTPVEQPGRIISRVRSIESGGGGIYMLEAIEAALRQLDMAPQFNKHMLLFADAADAESQAGALDLVRQARAAGVTASVIALGTPGDQHASFLSEVAATGDGQVYFTTSASELPRLFSKDTMAVTRAGFVQEPTGTTTAAGWFQLGSLATGTSSDFPNLAGYNLTYLREDGVASIVTTDEYQAPILSHAQRGLGRVVAYTGQIGGRFGADVVAWPGFRSLVSAIARFAGGLEEPRGIFTSTRLIGSRAIYEVEFDQDSSLPDHLVELTARVASPTGSAHQLKFERIDDLRFRAGLDLAEDGAFLGTLDLGLAGREGTRTSLDLPPISRGNSPEFRAEPDPGAARRRLLELARITGGGELATPTGLFEGPPSRDQRRSLQPALLIAALLAFLVEIAVRRLALFDRPRQRAVEATKAREAQTATEQASPSTPESTGVDEMAEMLGRLRR